MSRANSGNSTDFGKPVVKAGRLPGGSYSIARAQYSKGQWTVIKECKIYNHRDKDVRLVREMSFMDSLAGPAKALFPAVLHKQVQNKSIRYTMEYVPYLNFSQIIRSGSYSAKELSRMLSTIYDRLFTDLYLEADSALNALEVFDYFPLIDDRLRETRQQLAPDSFLRAFLDADQLNINGTSYLGLEATLRRAADYLRHITVPVTQNHGDLIFQDVLVDPQSHDFRLVDPNGDSVGYIYDFSKTLLCLETRYDMLYHGEYQLLVDLADSKHPSVELQFDANNHGQTLEEMRSHFWQYLESRQDQFSAGIPDWQQLLLVLCGLQNIAIVMFHALHHKEYERSCAFLVSGVKLVNEALNKD